MLPRNKAFDLVHFKHHNVAILKMIKMRNKVFARKKREANNENHSRLYKLLRNRVNREIKKSKKKLQC